MTSSSANLRGALYMTLAMATGGLSDTVVKALAEDMNMGQIMLLRGLAATVLIWLFARQRGALRPLRVAFQPMVIIRSLGEIGATVTFLIALARIPLADASALLQAIPLAVTMGAALFLREPVGWRRWTAIIVGFIGVLIVVQPGFGGFTADSLLVLATVAFAAVRDLATRRISADVPSLFISTVTAPAIALTGAVLVLPMGGWQPVTAIAGLELVAAALLLLVNYQFMTMAVRVGEISFVAPFRYTNLPCAMLLGLVVFAEVPGAFMIVGSAIIVGSGLYALHRERQLARSLIAVAAPAAR